jgi:hypothetical protein
MMSTMQGSSHIPRLGVEFEVVHDEVGLSRRPVIGGERRRGQRAGEPIQRKCAPAVAPLHVLCNVRAEFRRLRA